MHVLLSGLGGNEEEEEGEKGRQHIYLCSWAPLCWQKKIKKKKKCPVAAERRERRGKGREVCTWVPPLDRWGRIFELKAPELFCETEARVRKHAVGRNGEPGTLFSEKLRSDRELTDSILPLFLPR